MPRTVRVALGLLVGSLLVGVVRGFTAPQTPDPSLPSWFGSAIRGITMALLALLVAAIALRRRWALLIIAVLFVLGLPAVMVFPPEPGGGFVGWVALLVQTVTQAVAIGLLFGRPARLWFDASRQSRAA